MNHELTNSRSNRTPKLYDRIVKLRNEHLPFRIPEIAQRTKFPEKNQKFDFFLKLHPNNQESKVRKLLPEASKNRKSQFPETRENKKSRRRPLRRQGGRLHGRGGYNMPCRASFLHVEPFRLKLGFLAILLDWDGPP
ncbi:hypothetical protein GQ457_06G012890 [Hibiscus cannabinus]